MNSNLLKHKVAHIFRDKNLLLTAGLFFIVFCIFSVNSLHESYPDEFDNIMGGWLNLHGELIYKDWFTHHNPFAYWLASIIEIFSGQSFVKFRFLYSIFLFLLTIGGFYYLKKTIGLDRVKFYLGFILFLAISATYFWGHMLLADSLAAFLLIPVFGLLVLKIYYKLEFTMRDVVFISIFSFLTLLTSMTFSYLVAGMYLLAFLNFFFYPNGIKSFKTKKLYAILIVGFPYLLFLIYLLVTGSLSDYIFQGIKFNQEFYIYNYPRPEGSTFVNPFRYAIVMAQDFQANFTTLLLQARDFNFTYPFNITLAVVNTGLVIFLLIKRKFLLAAFIVFCLIYSNARSNPLTSKETDYQSAVYILISLFNICFSLYIIFQDLRKEIEFPKKLIISSIFILMLIYVFFNSIYLFRLFSYKAYDKFMGFAPTIYDRPVIAPVLNRITNEDDYVWVGPFAFEEIFYLDRKIPTNYVILLPEFAKSPKIQDKMMKDLRTNPPKVIYYDKQFGIRGSTPETYAGFFQDFIDQEYISLHELNKDGKIYASNLPKTANLDFETKLFIRNDSQDEVIQKLIENNFVSKTE